ncbi:hypothetical protein STFE110948_01935 [Streptobacillus felis]|uniref:hypothetical protein n=1 Tax=Streptobacillus felis TaxID=1384509 RepID=UPI000836FD59|nr:hypothetical protein [Streptobacillus felis]
MKKLLNIILLLIMFSCTSVNVKYNNIDEVTIETAKKNSVNIKSPGTFGVLNKESIFMTTVKNTEYGAKHRMIIYGVNKIEDGDKLVKLEYPLNLRLQVFYYYGLLYAYGLYKYRHTEFFEIITDNNKYLLPVDDLQKGDIAEIPDIIVTDKLDMLLDMANSNTTYVNIIDKNNRKEELLLKLQDKASIKEMVLLYKYGKSLNNSK